MDGAPELRRLLRETLAWCVPRFSMFDLAGSLRQLPRPVLDEAATELQGAVRAVQEGRRELVGGEVAGFLRPIAAGRILITHPAISLLHGFSHDDTGGFVDERDLPPWDTWIAAEGPLLAAWIPPTMISAVDCAIRVNAEGCIWWAEDGEDELSKKLLRLWLG